MFVLIAVSVPDSDRQLDGHETFNQPQQQGAGSVQKFPDSMIDTGLLTFTGDSHLDSKTVTSSYFPGQPFRSTAIGSSGTPFRGGIPSAIEQKMKNFQDRRFAPLILSILSLQFLYNWFYSTTYSFIHFFNE